MSDSREYAALKFSNKREAQAWLTERYERLVHIYPTLNRIPLALYIRRNTLAAMALTTDVLFEVDA